MKIARCSFIRVVLCACASLAVGMTSSVAALPIDSFNVPSETKCKGERTCKRSLTTGASLGGYLGIEVHNPAEGPGVSLLELKTSPSNKGRVVWGAAGSPAGRVTFSWDGDPNGGQISGAGLGCLNLTADGATAFILEDLAYSAACSSRNEKGVGEEKRQNECPPLTIETRIYDAMDPTGQRYSTSIIRRQYKMSGKDLRVPFSSFLREGPNGGAKISCVGAVSITIRADELTKSVVTFGPFFTNGACQTGDCLLPPPYSGEGSLVGVHTPTPSVTPTAVVSVTVQPLSALPSQTSTPVATSTVLATATSGATATASPTSTATPSAVLDRRELPSVPNVGVESGSSNRGLSEDATSLDVPPVESPVKEPLPITEEYIYGDVIERKQAAAESVSGDFDSQDSPTGPTRTTIRKPTPTADVLDLLP